MNEITGYGKLTESGRPYYVFDNVFNEEEVNNILWEQEVIANDIKRRENTAGAVQNGQSLKSANACWIHDIYTNTAAQSSPVIKATRKYYGDNIMKPMSEFHWAFDSMKDRMLSESVQFLYYADSDNYGTHVDDSSITFLYWLAKEPRGFEGGDLILDNSDTVEFKSNRLVALSLGMPHEVTKVKSTTDKKGYGRYCISTFLNIPIR